MELEEIQEIRRLYNFERKSLRQIAEIFNTDKNKIRSTLKRSQYEPFPFRSIGRQMIVRLSDDEKNDIYAAYYAEGLSMQKIADIYSTNKMRISRIIKAIGG